MKVTVCELGNNWLSVDGAWDDFLTGVQRERSELLVLPEMCLHDWLAGTGEFDPRSWNLAVERHDYWIDRFAEAPVDTILGTRPVTRRGRRHNEGFIWQRDSGCRAIHTKYYLPDEEGYWEASWYRRGRREFRADTAAGVTVGMMICTDLWFQAHAREYCGQGVHLLVCPRATPEHTTDRWLVGGRGAAIVAGAYCLSSNLNGANAEGPDFGGTGWVIDPELGEVLGATSRERPLLSIDIDIERAERAKQTYPRYVAD